jgi:hypothetical protein
VARVSNAALHRARAGKNDEFYTSLRDVEGEMLSYLEHDPDLFRGKVVLCPCDDPDWSNFTKFFADRFEALGLRGLVSTCFVQGGRGKFLMMSGPLDVRRGLLDGDGDFRSPEVAAFRDEADFVITNPPFSLFREFLSWILHGSAKFSVLGGVNAITYKDVFDLILTDRLWLGPNITGGDREFRVPDSYPLEASGVRLDPDGTGYIRVKGVRWFTNIEHSLRHRPLDLMTWEENVRFSPYPQVRGVGYLRYDDSDIIEVPYTGAIPSDHAGVMGVPITFLDRHDPEQFEIVGCSGTAGAPPLRIAGRNLYKRIFIRRRQHDGA